MTKVFAATGRRASPVFAAACVLVLAAMSLPASATQQRSFVASTGSDAASCTLAAPCRSFGTAIAHTNIGGEVIVLDSAGYGPVTITKSISVVAPTGVYAGITVTSGDGVTINAPGATAVLRGLAINGQGGTHGVRVHAADRVRIENCTISNMDQDGIRHEAPGAELVVLDTIVRDNANFGINLIADASIVLDRVRSEHNDSSGLRVGPMANKASAAVKDGVFSNNGGHGIVAFAGDLQNAYLQVDRSLIAQNAGSGVVGNSVGNSEVVIGLPGNGISRNGADGVLLSGTGTSAYVNAVLSGNTITANGGNGLHVADRGIATVAANALMRNGNMDFLCEGQSGIGSLSNNIAPAYDYTPSCHVALSGQ